MTNSFDHSWAGAAALLLITLPLLLLALGALIVATISICSRSTVRRAHSKSLLRELTAFAKVLRAGGQ